MSELPFTDLFSERHIGVLSDSEKSMSDFLGYSQTSKLIDDLIPNHIRVKKELDLPSAKSEFEALQEIREIANENKVFRSYIGMGYSGTITPPVILRNILENPGWYTQYTPYQAEISQGRLEALLNFQTMITDLTGLPIANASLLDEATAAAESMTMAYAAFKTKNPSSAAKSFFVSDDCHPQTIAVIQTRAEPLGIHVVVGASKLAEFSNKNFFGAIVQYPTTFGDVIDYSSFADKVHSSGALFVVAADILALTILKEPSSFGADIVVGSTQRFGVPMGYGGPHAAFMATKDEFKRIIPGRIIGLSQDTEGRPASRLALQTREQHIRREKATSNICTAQVLLAIISGMYAAYHGPKGLQKIATRVHNATQVLAKAFQKLGFVVLTDDFFDTIVVQAKTDRNKEIQKALESKNINLRTLEEGRFSISLDETVTKKDLSDLLSCFSKDALSLDTIFSDLDKKKSFSFKKDLLRTSNFLTHPVFNQYHSETEMLRYIRRLQNKDLSLTTSMIPLGSCTMKLNATAEMLPVTWPEFGSIHPFVPKDQAAGYMKLFKQLESWLAEITGFKAISLQPNAGSQGEFAGLLVIRKFHQSHGQGHRNICLIPKSAHGTNPASAVMAGMQVVVVNCDDSGNVDLKDLKEKAAAHKQNLAAAMITYPSTHGVFEETISEFCKIIHDHGGQVYMDGANMNAQVGLCRPGDFGPDVCHLNLHKTFCIPHGGGGPGMGPIGVAAHLVSFLPNHPVIECGGKLGAVSAAPFGSSSILPISWMYIRMMGAQGLKKATEVAILNANYIAKKLSPHYPVLYKGKTGLVAHECILDFRMFKESAGVEVEDVAKRLMDYGFHAPTVSFPVAGTLMIEPTESESKIELDRFCDVMIQIREEIREIENGKADRVNNVLKNAPHTTTCVMSDKWDRPYSREQAAFPTKWVKENKFWPPVGRVNGVLGDRNLICSCPPTEQYS